MSLFRVSTNNGEQLNERETKRFKDSKGCCPDCGSDLLSGKFYHIDSPNPHESYREISCMNGKCGSTFRAYIPTWDCIIVRSSDPCPYKNNPKESLKFTEEEQPENTIRENAAKEGFR